VFDVIGKRRWYFLFSALITIPGLLFVLMTPITDGQVGLQFSLDYTGGTKWVIRFEDPTITSDEVEEVLAANAFEEATVTSTGSGFFEIKTRELDLRGVVPDPTPIPTLAPTPTPAPSGSPDPSASPAPTESPEPSITPDPSATPGPIPGDVTGIPTTGEIGRLATALQDVLGPIAEQQNLTSIGAVVTSDLIAQAFRLILIGSIGILLWITFRFRDVKFGVAALAALVHDVVVVLGIFAFLGTFFGVEVDGLFVTAMLTVIGFSVHDTIVVFDRVRENRSRHAGEPFSEIVNHSILQTFGRSITTSLTVVLTLLALFLFGGAATQYFVLALLIGIVSGTYSSIFNASPILVVWQEWEDRRRGRPAATRAPSKASA
jgi:preprotein translocase subunit SecF